MPGRRISQSARAGLLFPVSRIRRNMKAVPQSVKRLTKPSAVYATAVIEYLTAEILELSGNACRDCKRSRISPRDIFLAIANDEELHKLLRNVTIPGGGVLPNIRMELIKSVLGTPVKPVKLVGLAKLKGGKGGRAKTLLNTPNFATAPLNPPKLTKKLSKNAAAKGVNLTLLSEKTLASGQKLTVLQADIVNVVADAIVHPTNNSFYLGGEVGTAISAKGGKEVRDEVSKLQRNHGNLGIGGVAISDAGSQMLCSKIIHVYSPSWNSGNQGHCIGELEKCVKNILTLADSTNIKTIALPSISSGGNGFPKQVAAETILRSINSYFRELKAPSSIKQVSFILYDAESVGVYTSELGKLDVSY